MTENLEEQVTAYWKAFLKEFGGDVDLLLTATALDLANYPTVLNRLHHEAVKKIKAEGTKDSPSPNPSS